MGGFELSPREDLRLGAHFARTEEDVEFDSAGSGVSDSTTVGVHATWFAEAGFHLDGALQFGWDNFETERLIAIGTLQEQTAGRHDGSHFTGFVSAGLPYSLLGITIEPELGAGYVQLLEDAVTEEGARELG